MSDHPHHGATTIKARRGGGGKWLLIGLFAVIIGGGGYYAYSTMMPGAPPPELAANDDPYADDPLYAGPIGDEDFDAESANLEAEPASSAPSSAAGSAAPAPRRAAAASTTPARPEAVPEATIGVTPVSLSTDEQGEDIVVTAPPRPIWASVPSERRLARFYPERARNLGQEGEASLECTVQTGGALECAQVSESHRGFGAAALRVARALRHAPQTADGRDATGTPLNLRVVFRLDEDRRS